LSSNLERAIDKSRSILELGDNGIAEETWKRATEFLWRMAEAFYDHGGHTFFPPKINPGPHGSIDFHWELQKFELSMNFPAVQFPSCHGTDSHGVVINRELDDPEDYVMMGRWMRYA
jgi:hypothetical protein